MAASDAHDKALRQQIPVFQLVFPQISSLLDEIRELSRKKPDDLVNKFKLGFVNEVLDQANSVLGSESRPLKSFERFDLQALPSNSDVVLILSQYRGALSRWKAARTERVGGTLHWTTEPKMEVK